MSEPATPDRTRTTLGAAEPQIFVTDFAAAVAFYTQKLSISVAFTYGEPPHDGQVVRDRARLNLRCITTPVIDPVLREQRELLSANITVDDARPLFLEFQTAGVAFAHTLRTEPWAAHTYIVRDPDGNLVLFAGQSDSGLEKPTA